MYMGLAKNLLNICMRDLIRKFYINAIIHNFPVLVNNLMNKMHKNCQ